MGNKNSIIIQLCSEGMELESAGKIEEAKNLYLKAWEKRQDNFDACIVAHYVARHQSTIEKNLTWNLTSLDYANKINDERTKSFYPSLYANIGRAYQLMDKKDEALRYYQLAFSRIDDLPDDTYGSNVKTVIAQGLKIK